MGKRKKDNPKTQKTSPVEADYPNVADWVHGCGWIEVGEQGWQGFVVRAMDEGGLIYESEECRTLAEALSALESGIRTWFEENS
jgi:hypothetical protein